MRVNRAQAFVIGGYTLGARNFDAIVFGYYGGGKLLYAGRTRSGFTPASRDQLFRRFKKLAAETCPFVNLPQAKSGRWGEGLTAGKMLSAAGWRPRWWDSSSSLNGRRTATCGTHGLWACARTRSRGK
ncbi:MAG: hypothetical protein ABSG03_37415 [Bryobacteraceae bacterium]|jgi:ATP-dependent DNA ligase